MRDTVLTTFRTFLLAMLRSTLPMTAKASTNCTGKTILKRPTVNCFPTFLK